MRTDRIPVYSEDGFSILRHVSEEQAYLMTQERYATGEPKYHAASRRVHGKGRQEYLHLQPEPKHKDSNNFSAASLTTSDLLAALGCNPPKRNELDHIIKPGRIHSAKLKIKLWPRIGDHKAIRVCPA